MIIKRHSAPNKFDIFPKGTICHVINSLSDHIEIYVQTCVSEDTPIWIKLEKNENPLEKVIKQEGPTKKNKFYYLKT